MENINWRIIKGYENYMVSDNGMVKNCKTNHIIKPSVGTTGYYYLTLNKKKFKVHRLVALAFIDNPENKKVVDHIDGHILNNHFSNLRWATISENMMNSKKPKNNTSGIKGVSWSKEKEKWRANISIDHNQQHLGYFNNIEDAITARKKAVIIYFKEYANEDDK